MPPPPLLLWVCLPFLPSLWCVSLPSSLTLLELECLHDAGVDAGGGEVQSPLAPGVVLVCLQIVLLFGESHKVPTIHLTEHLCGVGGGVGGMAGQSLKEARKQTLHV